MKGAEAARKLLAAAPTALKPGLAAAISGNTENSENPTSGASFVLLLSSIPFIRSELMVTQRGTGLRLLS